MPIGTIEHSRHLLGQVVEVQQLAPLIWVHGYRFDELTEAPEPGQFLHVRIDERTSPLLRRPFSVLDCNREARTCRILFKVVGAGTEILSRKRVGDRIDVLGPLGSSFVLPKSVRRLVMVAGGIGMVPLYFLAQRLAAGDAPVSIDYWFGARDASEIYLLDDLARWCARVEAVTEDGSTGLRGRVTDFADQWSDAEMILTCGPNPMLEAIQRLTGEWPMPTLAAMESFMGCGLGACQGCVIGTQDRGYERVCTEGPVFDLRRLEFHT